MNMTSARIWGVPAVQQSSSPAPAGEERGQGRCGARCAVGDIFSGGEALAQWQEHSIQIRPRIITYVCLPTISARHLNWCESNRSNKVESPSQSRSAIRLPTKGQGLVERHMYKGLGRASLPPSSELYTWFRPVAITVWEVGKWCPPVPARNSSLVFRRLRLRTRRLSLCLWPNSN
jgi:hypothetical protein